MKKLSLALMCIATLALTACGGSKSGGSASGSESEGSSNASGLVDGKWPAAIYDKYGYTEIPTKGHIVCTELSGEEDSYLYRVYYKGVTREELQAWVNEPLSDDVCCLDNDNEMPNVRLSDDQVWQQIREMVNVTNSSAFQHLPNDKRREVFLVLKEKGASLRQLERLTGVGRGLIQKL